jgi:hypothetical protein
MISTEVRMYLHLSRLAPVLLLAMAACGSNTTGNGNGDGGGGGTDDGSASVDGGGVCAVPCLPPQVCGRSNQCITPGTCASDADCESGKQCVSGDAGDKVCIPGSSCGSEKLVADVVPPNLLVVLDRSCSMTDMVGNTTKWAIAVAALNNMTQTYAGKIRFGLTLFPDTVTPNCGQGMIPIPVGPNNETPIRNLLTAALQTSNANFPDGPCVTNIDTAMQQAATEPGFNDTTRQSYALLVTDGAQSGCNLAGGDTGTATIVANLFTQRNIPTYVIGFGSGVDAPQLNILAVNGGRPRSTMPNRYYDAGDQASLDAALSTIGAQTLGCVYQLQKAPPDPTQIYVFFDKVSVPRDPTHMGNWDYDATTNRVTFYGAACTQLKSGTVKVLDIVFGCDVPPPS